jgi:hypothetical protein
VKIPFKLKNGRAIFIDSRLAERLHSRGRGAYIKTEITREHKLTAAINSPSKISSGFDFEESLVGKEETEYNSDSANAESARKRGRPSKQGD